MSKTEKQKPSERISRNVTPIGMLMEGRPAFVVGGGKVATRKVGVLLDGHASVSVLSPTVSEALQTWVDQGRVRHVLGEFSPEKLGQEVLVYAATNNRAVNRAILGACRERGILCSCVDGNWSDSDFVTPATLRRGELTVAISTGGKSCRRSRLIRENMDRHIELVESAELIVVGTSHNYLSVDQREPYQLVGKHLQQVGQMLMGLWGIHEFMLLNTCNRVELLAIVSPQPGLAELVRRVMDLDHLRTDQSYVKQGLEAFEHVTMVAAGLLSQTPGEYHIASQLKQALESASEAGWAGALIKECTSHALHVAKDIRNRTHEYLRGFEIEDLCLEYLDANTENLSSRKTLVLGAGEVAKGLVERLVARGQSLLWCYHRNCPEVPDEWAGHVTLCTFNDLREHLGNVDLVLCATGAEGHILHTGHAPFFNQDKEIQIVDLSMPRNVAPELDGLTGNLHVVDLDGLKRAPGTDMVKVWEQSRQSLDEHKELYERIITSFQSGNPQ